MEKKESLFIDGHQLNYNKPHVQKDGTEIHYFYCNKKDKFKCKSSAKALKEDGKFSLYSYTGLHSMSASQTNPTFQLEELDPQSEQEYWGIQL